MALTFAKSQGFCGPFLLSFQMSYGSCESQRSQVFSFVVEAIELASSLSLESWSSFISFCRGAFRSVGSSLRASRRSFCLCVRPLVLDKPFALDDVSIFVTMEGKIEEEACLVDSIY